MEHRQLGEWKGAIELLCQWGKGKSHLDDLLEGAELSRLRWLVMDVFRNWLLVDRILSPRLKRNPRPVAHNLLRLAVAECMNRGKEIQPKVVHHAVEVARALKLSNAEAGFVNAVLRSVLLDLQKGEVPCWSATHPDWLVRRWIRHFGEEATEALVNWNQRIPDLTLRADARPPYAEETAWEGYFKLGRARFGEALPDLESGKVYMQDPFTGIPVKLLGVHPGESVADLCAAPGGKTRLLAEALGGQGVLLALDKPGRRVDRLKENLLRSGMSWVKVISAVLESSGPATGGGITGGKPVDAVLIDVPCSNTGVIQKRPDVKLRLSESGVSELSLQQLRLLEAASGWVRPGGRLVYSTCSIEEEENQGVIDCFLKEHPEWQLMESVMSYPWVCQHDGGGAFLLTNRAPQ